MNVDIDDKLEREFRLVVGRLKGANKGALKEAIEEALQNWMAQYKK